MEEALSFSRAFEAPIYLLVGLAALVFARRFFVAWQELRGAGFGLEREQAQTRLNQSAGVLALLLIIAVAEFVLVSFVVPAVPGATPLLTPTLNLLATPTITLLPSTSTTAADALATFTPVPGAPAAAGGCVPDKIVLGLPQNGQDVSSVVVVSGTANIENFGFYKLEIKRPEDASWLTIQAGNVVVVSNKLGDWDTRRLPPGPYQLGLVVVDNQAHSSPPCTVQVNVLPAPEKTPNP